MSNVSVVKIKDKEDRREMLAYFIRELIESGYSAWYVGEATALFLHSLEMADCKELSQ